MITRTLLAAAALASFAATAAGAAESYKFRYHAFELQTQGGRAALMTRLDRQVDRYCDANTYQHLAGMRASKQCKEEVMAEIISKIDNVAFASLQP